MMSIEIFRLYIYIHMYLPFIYYIHIYVSIIPYIPLVYFNDMQYFLPLRACAHDAGDTSQSERRREREQAHRVATI